MAKKKKESFLPWIDSEGGPIVIMPVRVASRWRGTNVDYDRANDERENDVCVGLFAIGSLRIGKDQLLVLESSSSTTFCRLDGGGVFVRGGRVTKEEVESAVASTKKWKKTKHVLGGGPFVMFDSALTGKRALAEKCVKDELPKGRFTIDAAEVKVADGWLTLIRASKA